MIHHDAEMIIVKQGPYNVIGHEKEFIGDKELI